MSGKAQEPAITKQDKSQETRGNITGASTDRSPGNSAGNEPAERGHYRCFCFGSSSKPGTESWQETLRNQSGQKPSRNSSRHLAGNKQENCTQSSSIQQENKELRSQQGKEPGTQHIKDPAFRRGALSLLLLGKQKPCKKPARTNQESKK